MTDVETNGQTVPSPRHTHTHTPVPPTSNREKEQSQTSSTMISISQTSHATFTHTHTQTHTETHPTHTHTRTGLFPNCFGFQPQAHIWITWALCLDSVPPSNTRSVLSLPPGQPVELHPHSCCNSQPFYNTHMTALTARANESRGGERSQKTNMPLVKSSGTPLFPLLSGWVGWGGGRSLESSCEKSQSFSLNAKTVSLQAAPDQFFYSSSACIPPFLLSFSCFPVESQAAALSLYSQQNMRKAVTLAHEWTNCLGKTGQTGCVKQADGITQHISPTAE